MDTGSADQRKLLAAWTLPLTQVLACGSPTRHRHNPPKVWPSLQHGHKRDALPEEAGAKLGDRC